MKTRNNNSTRSNMMETLESRRLMSADVVGGILTVTGTNGDDDIVVADVNGTIIVTGATPTQQFFPSSTVAYINVFSFSGRDHVAVDVPKYVMIAAGAGDDFISNERGASGNVSSRLYGEAGNDLIFGSLLHDHLYGGDGNDIIRGRGGSDHISGDAGSDKLYGGDGYDRINGGAGVDYMYGEGQDDILEASNDGSFDYVDGGDGYDCCFYDYSPWNTFTNDRLSSTVESKVKD